MSDHNTFNNSSSDLETDDNNELTNSTPAVFTSLAREILPNNITTIDPQFYRSKYAQYPTHNTDYISDIFQNPYNVYEYDDIRNDTSIKGKFKIFYRHRPDTCSSSGGGVLLNFILQYAVKPINLLSFHSDYRCRRYDDDRYTKERTGPKNNKDLTVCSSPIPYKNLECRYKDTTIWLSIIPSAGNICSSNPWFVPSLLVISIDSELDNYNDFMKTNFMQELTKEAKIWHMTNILGEEYNEEDFFEVYTFNDGYWELKKGNYIRSKETLFLEQNFYEKLIKKMHTFNKDRTRQIYKRLNIPYKLNILLHGPPGTGKTSFIEVMASELKRSIRFMQITPAITDEQFSAAVATLGDQDILVCEDIDCLFVDRKKSDSEKNSMTFSGLLNCFDGINGGKNGLIVFLTTNYKCSLDKALTRPGRVDIMEEFKYMSKKSLSSMVKFYFEDNYSEDDFNQMYTHIKSNNITGAIMSKFLLQLLLDEDYKLHENIKQLREILSDNDYEAQNTIEKNLYM